MGSGGKIVDTIMLHFVIPLIRYAHDHVLKKLLLTYCPNTQVRGRGGSADYHVWVKVEF